MYKNLVLKAVSSLWKLVIKIALLFISLPKSVLIFQSFQIF